MSDVQARERICEYAQSMFERGLSFGSAGNISIRTDSGWIVTPTGSSLGRLDPARLSAIDENGQHKSGDAPTKELGLHLAMYRERPSARAVVHLHATHSVAVSCMADIDPENVLPPITAYYVMRVGTLPLIPYFAPGDEGLVEAVKKRASKHAALLLANHGPVLAGTSLEAAVNAIEELEETARLFLLLAGRKLRCLDAKEVAALQAKYPVS